MSSEIDLDKTKVDILKELNIDIGVEYFHDSEMKTVEVTLDRMVKQRLGDSQ